MSFRQLNIDEVKAEIINASEASSVYVACDCQVHSGFIKGRKCKVATYSTVVIIHVDSSRGCMVFGRNDKMEYYGSLRQKLMQEVYFAVEVAQQLLPVIGNKSLEVHLDINSNPRYKSHVCVKEACGYVRGVLGIEPKLKPEAQMSSNAADHFNK